MEMGTGKSKVTIDNFCYLFSESKIKQVLIVAPKGVYLNWAMREIPVHCWDGIDFFCGWYASSLKKKEKDRLDEVMSAKVGKLNILLINVEALATKKGEMAASYFCKNAPTMMIVDESTSIKNAKSKRTKACIRIGLLCPYRRILTGTPITNSPLDVYSQFEFLERGSTGFNSFFAFKHHYAKLEPMKLGNRSFEKIVGFQNLENLTSKISPFSIRILKDECLDLPDKTYMSRQVEMTQEQKLMYMTLKHESLVMLEDGLLTSNNALTTLLKLQQITCGHVKDDYGNIKDIPSNRIKSLTEILNEIDINKNKVIIWCNFQRDVQLINSEIENSVTYYGLDSQEEREASIERFKNDKECRVFIGTPHCGGKGITLNEASYVIYYSNSFKLEDRLQSEDRCHRIGQNKKVTYIDLYCPQTVDDKIRKALTDKKSLAESVLKDVTAFRGLV